MYEQQQTPLNESGAEPQGKKDRAALGWFGLGALIGGLAVAGFMTFMNAQGPAVDLAAIRQAAREGAAEAVAALPVAPANNESAAPAAPAGPEGNTVPGGDKVVGRLANSMGAENAPVTIIEYSDFNCGFCKKFHAETFSRIVDDYVKTGQVKVSYKHYPFLAQSSVWKAEAAECAAEQGKFWDFHNALFDSKVSGQGDETAVKQALSALASELQLDANAFTACMSAGQATALVQSDAAEGQQMRVQGTPSFLINGKLLVGAQPYEAFKQAIDAALAQGR
jgi:protein-disulfide isomerase